MGTLAIKHPDGFKTRLGLAKLLEDKELRIYRSAQAGSALQADVLSEQFRANTLLWRWAKAYVIAWPVAATTGFLVFPFARRATEEIMRRIG